LSLSLAYLSHESSHSAAIVWIGLLTTWVACLAISKWSKIRYDQCLKKNYQAQEKQLCGQPMTIMEEGISGKSADLTSSYEFQWASFSRLIDLTDGLLFLRNSVSFVRIPKSSLTNDEVRQIMEWWAPYAPKA
jgi:hypothetical protein